MNYTPDKLEGIAFGGSILHGYSRSQVDAALSKIIEDYNQNLDEINELKNKNAELNEAIKRYKTVEEAMQHCLLLAQNVSDEMKVSASEKAQSIVEAAEKTSQKMISDASQKVNRLNFAYEEMKSKVFTFKTKSEALLGAQLDVLKQLSDDSNT